MNELDDMINQIEERESYEDMHFSLYSIPSYYNEVEEPTNDNKRTDYTKPC